ncbi:M56 family metallopeptidase [Thalassotalea mangrovi]|uniref:M56 family metallopeptidase n=1 Tax=Thalassotalea mangrovi TaxID=2572245 RepID=A0A4U1B9H5_9GAMM|nr:M56 family metallopeptidase [Thalassotalea mangrovi]TKB46662.1 M56 family metallopeptidase [Thalassotalea mangrovi]
MSSDWLQILQYLSYTLGHFLWQGGIIALLLRVCLTLIDKRQAQLRYVCSIVAMLTCILVPIYTFSQLLYLQPSSSVQVLNWTEPLLQSTQSLLYTAGLDESLQLSHLVAITWFVTVAILLCKFVFEYQATQATRHYQVLPATASVQNLFRQLRIKLGLSENITLLLSFNVSSPMTLGFFKPVVLLPAQLVTGLDEEQLKLVLLHELIHIKRHDYAVNLCQALVELMLFFHPAVHWIGRQIRLERECVCDQGVIQEYDNKLTYGRLIADLAEYHRHNSALSIAANGGELTQRVQRLFNKDNKPHSHLRFVPAMVLALCSIGLVVAYPPGHWSLPQQPTAEQSAVRPTHSSTPGPNSMAHWLLNNDGTPAKNPTFTVINSQPAITAQQPPLAADAHVALWQQDETPEPVIAQHSRRQHPGEHVVSSNSEDDGNITATAVTVESLARQTKTNVSGLPSQNVLPVNEPIAINDNQDLTTTTRNQMTVFAKKVKKSMVMPVVALQDDLSGQAQLFDSHQLIAQTYPNQQQQAEWIEAEVLKSYAPRYPKLAARRKLSKTVQVSFVIDVEGKVTQLDFKEERQVRYFKNSVSEAMKKWRFKPATVNGEPVESSMTKIFDFNLEG